MSFLQWWNGECTFYELRKIMLGNNRVENIINRYNSQESRLLQISEKNNEKRLLLLHFKEKIDKEFIKSRIDEIENIYQCKIEEINCYIKSDSNNLKRSRRFYFFCHNEDRIFVLLTSIAIYSHFSIKDNPYFRYINRNKFRINSIYCEYKEYLLPPLYNIKDLFLPISFNREITNNLNIHKNFDSDNVNTLLKFQKEELHEIQDWYFQEWRFIRSMIQSHPTYEKLIKGKKIKFLHMGCHLGTEIQFLKTNKILSEESILHGFVLNSNSNSISLANKWFYDKSLLYDFSFADFFNLEIFMKYKDPYDVVYIDSFLDSFSLEYQRIFIYNARKCLHEKGYLIGRIVGLDEFPPKSRIEDVDIHMHTVDSLRKLLQFYFSKVKIYPTSCDDLFNKRPILYFKASQ